MQDKTRFEMPAIVTFERDELIVETVYTATISNLDQVPPSVE